MSALLQVSGLEVAYGPVRAVRGVDLEVLLDDPLQHNDIIHAAAFVDVMRNLVELEGYQLIMSRHDRAEGAFIARKFDAAGLPCTVVALTAPSKDGVRFEAPRHNSAARALLDDRLALSGELRMINCRFALSKSWVMVIVE